PSISIGGQNEIGASRRKVAKAASRMSSLCTQKSSDSRWTSASGISGGGVPFGRVVGPFLGPVSRLTWPSFAVVEVTLGGLDPAQCVHTGLAGPPVGRG